MKRRAAQVTTQCRLGCNCTQDAAGGAIYITLPCYRPVCAGFREAQTARQRNHRRNCYRPASSTPPTSLPASTAQSPASIRTATSSTSPTSLRSRPSSCSTPTLAQTLPRPTRPRRRPASSSTSIRLTAGWAPASIQSQVTTPTPSPAYFPFHLYRHPPLCPA